MALIRDGYCDAGGHSANVGLEHVYTIHCRRANRTEILNTYPGIEGISGPVFPDAWWLQQRQRRLFPHSLTLPASSNVRRITELLSRVKCGNSAEGVSYLTSYIIPVVDTSNLCYLGSMCNISTEKKRGDDRACGGQNTLETPYVSDV